MRRPRQREPSHFRTAWGGRFAVGLFQLRRRFKLDTQTLRSKMIRQLEQLFDYSYAIARGQIQYQRVRGETQSIPLRERQSWFKVAGYIAQILENLSEGFDEKQVDADLEALEKLMNEANSKGQAKPAEGTVENTNEKRTDTPPI